jgi:hypothetical protein
VRSVHHLKDMRPAAPSLTGRAAHDLLAGASLLALAILTTPVVTDRQAFSSPPARETCQLGGAVTPIANKCDTMSMSAPELLAATNEPVPLSGPRTDATLRPTAPVRLSDRIRHADSGRRFELLLKDVSVPSSPGGFYSIYLNLPRGEAAVRSETSSRHWLHTFYILDRDATVTMDATAKIAALEADNLIDNQLTVTIVPAPSAADQAASPAKIGAGTIGRIELIEKCR